MNKVTKRTHILICVLALSFCTLCSTLLLGGLLQKPAEAKTRGGKPLEDPWIMTNYADLSGKQGMFYTLFNPAQKKLVVVDGGWAENQKQVRNVIKKYGNVVHAWILTHYHDDHIEAFNEIYAKPKGIDIRKVYVSPMDYAAYMMVAKAWDDPEDFGRFLTQTEGDTRIHRVKRNEKFKMAGMTFHFLNTYDKILLDEVGSNDLPNDASLIFKVSGGRDSVLFCSDAHSTSLAEYLIERFSDELESTYVQVGHHGNNSFPTFFYEEVDPKTAIFDAPLWLVLDRQYTTWKLEQWCSSHGIKVHDFRTAPNRFTLK